VRVFTDLPLFPLGIVLFPQERLPLHIFEPRYREMTTRCIDNNEPFAIVLIQDHAVRDVGCTARIEEVLSRFDDGRTNILVRGDTRVRLREVLSQHSYHTARADPLPDVTDTASAQMQRDAIDAYAALAAAAGDDAPTPALGASLSYRIAARLELGVSTRQELLESREEPERLRRVTLVTRETRRGVVLAREAERRARRNGHVRTADELAAELGL
jgi:Lon protease-like protein